MATIIVLNGTSSAGKSSLANELQKGLLGSYLIVPIDSFISMIPDNSFDEKIEGVVTAMGKTVRALADERNNIILDTVFYDPSRRCSELKAELQGHRIIWVKVYCSDLRELSRRELARHDRPAGTACSQVTMVYENYLCDVDVDTSKGSIQENVEKIKAFVEALKYDR